MKLRNKKTGIRGCIEYVMRTINPITGEPLLTVRYKDNSGITCYKDYETIEGFNEDWEDYKPAEPLIKDEEIRKAVIAWAKANSQQTSIAYKQLEEAISCLCFIDFGGLVIEFNKPIDGLTSGKIYKFTELCGEEGE